VVVEPEEAGALNFVIARSACDEAIQLASPKLDCFASLAMTVLSIASPSAPLGGASSVAAPGISALRHKIDGYQCRETR